MTQKPDGDDPRRPNAIWKEQAMHAQTFTPHMLARRAQGLDAHIRRRNLFEYMAAGAVIVFCLAIAALLVASGIETTADAISLAGILTLAAGSAIVAWQMHARTGAPRASSGDRATLASMRAELVRQRDALRRVWLWYLLPFAPGLFLIYGADLFRPGANLMLGSVLFAGTLVLVVFICWLNLVAAKRMDAEIEKLDDELG